MPDDTVDLNFRAIAAILEPVIYERVLAHVTADKLDVLVQAAIERCVMVHVESALGRISGGHSYGWALQDKVTAVLEEKLAGSVPGGLNGYIERLVEAHFTPPQKKQLVRKVKERIAASTKSSMSYRLDDAVVTAVEATVSRLITENAEVLTKTALLRLCKLSEAPHGT